MEVFLMTWSLYPQSQLLEPLVLQATTLPLTESRRGSGLFLGSSESSAHSGILPFTRLLPSTNSRSSLTPGSSSTFQFCFRLTCGTWTCHCWVNISPIFFLGPCLFSHRCLLPQSRQRAISCHRIYRSFPVSQQKSLAVFTSYQACKGFTFSYRLNVFTSPVFIHSSNMDVLNNYYVLRYSFQAMWKEE